MDVDTAVTAPGSATKGAPAVPAGTVMMPLRLRFTLLSAALLVGLPLVAIAPPEHFGARVIGVDVVCALAFVWLGSWATGGFRSRVRSAPWPHDVTVQSSAGAARSVAGSAVFLFVVWGLLVILDDDAGILLPISIGTSLGHLVNARRIARAEVRDGVQIYGARRRRWFDDDRGTMTATYGRPVGTRTP